MHQAQERTTTLLLRSGLFDTIVSPRSQADPPGDERCSQPLDDSRKFTGKERDNESGLDFFGARYYWSSAGRFSSVDPLYIDLRRLGDPQQINLYAYVRNNPLRLVDPDGLSIKFNCSNPADCQQAQTMLDGRDGKQFTINLDKKGMLAIAGKVNTNTLSSREKALYDAIIDKRTTGTVNIVANTGTADFGVNKNGVVTVDLQNLSFLDSKSNAGGLKSGDVLGHEALEAYFSTSMSPSLAHATTNASFPGLRVPTNYQNLWDPGRTDVLGSVYEQLINRQKGGRERVTIQYNTPIPAIELFGKTTQQKQQLADQVGSRVTGVTYVP